MQKLSLEQELKNNAYPGRGIVIGKSPNGKYAVTAYFIMGRSENSRNRVFVNDGEGIRTIEIERPKSYYLRTGPRIGKQDYCYQR